VFAGCLCDLDPIAREADSVCFASGANSERESVSLSLALTSLAPPPRSEVGRKVTRRCLERADAEPARAEATRKRKIMTTRPAGRRSRRTCRRACRTSLEVREQTRPIIPHPSMLASIHFPGLRKSRTNIHRARQPPNPHPEKKKKKKKKKNRPSHTYDVGYMLEPSPNPTPPQPPAHYQTPSAIYTFFFPPHWGPPLANIVRSVRTAPGRALWNGRGVHMCRSHSRMLTRLTTAISHRVPSVHPPPPTLSTSCAHVSMHISR